MTQQSLAVVRAGYRVARRVVRHGPGYPWRRYVAPARILKARPIHTDRSGDVTVCTLTSSKDWFSCLWALVSFYRMSELRLPLMIYSDGSLTGNHARDLAKVFPEGRLVDSSVGQSTANCRLSGFPNCLKFASVLPYARKIIDLPILCDSQFILVLDSDVLFLQRPEELIQHLGSAVPGRFVFQHDFQDAYFADRSEIRERFDVDVPPRVNTGIMLADVSRFDYSRIEGWLEQGALQRHPWAEQTLWAMYAGAGRTVYLGRGYDVTMAPHFEASTIAKHYVKPIRDFMYTEGIPYLERRLEFAAD